MWYREVAALIDDLVVIISEGERYTIDFKESPDKDLPSESCTFITVLSSRVHMAKPSKGSYLGRDAPPNMRVFQPRSEQ